MPNQIIINGKTLFTQSNLPIAGLKVDLWDGQNIYGLIASTHSENDGDFSFYINEPISNSINVGTLIYKTYRCNELIANTKIVEGELVLLKLTEDAYDTVVGNDEQDCAVNYLKVYGDVRDVNQREVPNVHVCIYESGFRSEVLLGKTKTGLYGNYSLNLAVRKINHSTTLTSRAIIAKAFSGELLIATSRVFFINDEAQIDLNLTCNEAYIAPSFHENLLGKIQAILGAVTFADFASEVEFPEVTTANLDEIPDVYPDLTATTPDGDGNGELSHIAIAIGYEIIAVQKIVRSYQYATDIDSQHDMMHALVESMGFNYNPLLIMNEQDIRETIEKAIDKNFIPTHTNSEINTFISQARVFQINATRQIPIDGETHTLGNVLDSIFGGATPAATTNEFLTFYQGANIYDSMDDFWVAYSALDATNSAKAQRGLRLATLTGQYPEMIKSLMTDTQSGIHVLAEWSDADWIDRITSVSAQAGKLCVPQAIIGENTNDNVIKTLYAKKLKTIAQDWFPLTALKVVLQDSGDGPGLIEDNDLRSETAGFINNNPNFDLRINSVFDIDDTSLSLGLNLAGVTDVGAMQAALAPMQRLLRTIAGNPGAVASLMTAGITSAHAISSMSMSSFVAAYSAAFGSSTAATVAYGTASALSSVAASTYLSIAPMGGGGLSLPPGGILSSPTSAGTMAANSSAYATATLRSMFGDTSYCACEQCLSVYSPGAYFTDIMKFLKGNPTLYNEMIRRRPDLEHVDITCKNTNTPMPYIDLVIELLEVHILRKFTQPPVTIRFYQTGGTPDQLAAEPEHVWKDVGTTMPYVWGYVDYEDYKAVYNPIYTGGGAPPPFHTTSGENLTNAVYPFNLPFSLPAEETRTYLSYLGKSRYEMMKLMQPISVPGGAALSDFNIYCELLNLTEAQGKIITSNYTTSTSVYLFYGFTSASVTGFIDPANPSVLLSMSWQNLLADRLDILVQQLKMSYKQFLQFLTTDFLNAKSSTTGLRPILVGAVSLADAGTCDLTKLQLTYPSTTARDIFLGKLHRFVRLWHTQKMSVAEWDIFFRALRITDINDIYFEIIGRILEIADKLDIKVSELAGWWGYIDLHQDVDYAEDPTSKEPSVYDLAYRNRAVINAPLAEFTDLGGKDPMSVRASSTPLLPTSYTGFTAQIAAANKIEEEELIAILEYMASYTSIPSPLTPTFPAITLSSQVTLEVLSPIYAISSLSKKLNITVFELLEILYDLDITIALPIFLSAGGSATGVSGGPAAHTLIGYRLEELEELIAAVEAIKLKKLSLTEIVYVTRVFSPDGPIAPSVIKIQAYYEKLRKDLQKHLPEYTWPSSPTAEDLEALKNLKNAICQSVAKEFDLSMDLSALIISKTQIGGDPAPRFYMALQTPTAFPNSTIDITEGTGSTLFDELYVLYRFIYKCAYIINKLRLNIFEAKYLLNNPVTGFSFSQLNDDAPALSVSRDQFKGLLQLIRWVDLKDKLSLVERQLVRLLAISASPGTGPALTANYTTWLDILNRPSWGNMLTELMGATATTTGLMNVTFSSAPFPPGNRKSVERIWRILALCATCTRIGLKPTSLLTTLQQGLSMADSHQVLLAAKGKNDEHAWAEIARPLRNILRIKQRDALLGFVINHPDLSNTFDLKRWSNENDLHAFLLIDPLMEPCMLTSRLKQAICSVQLFVDRVLLSLEFPNYNTSTAISMAQDEIREWRQWRAWYSIWASNRMVFLYPENWLEPELRDDKSPFYEEMESITMQGDLTVTRTEDALLHYLRKLQSVGRLEIVGSCDMLDPNDGKKIITYTFGRTYEEPYKYYFRKMQDYFWSAWEQIDIDAKSNHIVPIVSRGRLYLFWVTFREKNVKWNGYWQSLFTTWFMNDPERTATETTLNEPAPGTPGYIAPVYTKQIEATLNWSEYKDGQWLEQQSGKRKANMDLNLPVLKDFETLFKGYVMSKTTPATKITSGIDKDMYAFLAKNRTLSLVDFIVSRFQVAASATTSGELFIYLNHPMEYAITPDVVHSVAVFNFRRGDPKVTDNGMYLNVPAVSGTLFSNNKMTFYPGPGKPAAPAPVTPRPLKINDVTVLSSGVSKYLYELYATNGVFYRQNGSATDVLGSSPNGDFTLTTVSNAELSPLEKGFYFADDKHTFYSRIIDPSNFPSTTLAVSVKTSLADAATFYSPGRIKSTTYSSLGITAKPSTAKVPLKFYFQTFYHLQVDKFIELLNTLGIDELMKLGTQSMVTGNMTFSGYSPKGIVHTERPTDTVDFDFKGAYSIYNWELFFHVPLLIAKRLSADQKFDEARRWFHYIFDPTSNRDASGPTTHVRRVWKFLPFYREASKPMSTLTDLMNDIHYNVKSAIDQVELWKDNPFKPHVIARVRTVAYMRNTVMCYLDNLIAWADKLYRQNTIESINQATNLYIMVANILGPKPEEVPKRIGTGPRTFQELDAAGLDAFSNAKVSMENFIDPNSMPRGLGGGLPSPDVRIFYFCFPPNPKLLSYWDTVASRLFNIRHCKSIDGVVQELPLFEPPIDPALLIRAAAAGMDAGSVLDSLSTPPMPYKFTTMIQKVNELCNDVKALGGALLAAIEKKDAEVLAALRTSHEAPVLEAMKRVKQAQIDEAKANIVAAAKMKDAINVRKEYYSSRPFKIAKEMEHIKLLDEAQRFQNKASTFSAVASVVSIIPEINFQVPFALGPSFGGRELSAVFNALSTIQAQKAAQKSHEANKAITEAGYERRRDDWDHQAKLAATELGQIEKQVIAAEMRKAVAEKELDAQVLQISNAKEVDQYMRSKYTNVELYNWMITQVSSSYFQAYQLAYDVAKRAEQALKFELPLYTPPGGEFIKFGYWDSLRKGLYAGEALQYDVRRMELAYLENNKRELEMTKHISLLLNDPEQLLQLRELGSCTIKCTAAMLNFDFPGQYMRRVKSVSISIPCVAGPYTTIAATLHQTGSVIEKVPSTPLTPDPATTYPQGIATSSAQNDSGVFELSFRDERHLPFEGTGAICDWQLALMDEKDLRQFDYDTITDVIVHVKYTAQYDNTKDSADKIALANAIIGSAADPRNAYFSMKHHFSNAWFAYSNAFASDPTAQFEMTLKEALFPYLCRGKDINISNFSLEFRFKTPPASGDSYSMDMEKPGGPASGPVSISGLGTPPIPPYVVAFGSLGITVNAANDGTFKFTMTDNNLIVDPEVNMNEIIDDIYLIVEYKLSV